MSYNNFENTKEKIELVFEDTNKNIGRLIKLDKKGVQYINTYGTVDISRNYYKKDYNIEINEATGVPVNKTLEISLNNIETSDRAFFTGYLIFEPILEDYTISVSNFTSVWRDNKLTFYLDGTFLNTGVKIRLINPTYHKKTS